MPANAGMVFLDTSKHDNRINPCLNDPMTIAANITTLQQKIADNAKRYHRNPNHITLLAASKSQPIELIIEAYQAGIRCFGENYLQEALLKIAALSDLPIEWHFIGRIQRNKTRKIAEHFAWVQSVDDPIIATRLSEQRPAHLPPLNICIEVNIGNESAKSGLPPAEVSKLIDHCLTLPNIRLRGLMSIPPHLTQYDQQRAIFNQLYRLWHQLRSQHPQIDTLSMGMTEDFEAAIAEGSTMIRIGRSIFGPRRQPIIP